MFETDKIKKRGHYIPSLFIETAKKFRGFLSKRRKRKKSSPSGSSFQVKFIWSSNEAHLILGRMYLNYVATYLELRRDASVTASGRTRCYVGTQFREQHWRLYGKNSIKTPLKSPKTPEYRYFYGNIWQIMAIKSYCNIGTFS